MLPPFTVNLLMVFHCHWTKSKFPKIVYKGPGSRLSIHLQQTLSRKILSQFSSVAQSCPTLCDPMNRSTPGFLVFLYLVFLYPCPSPTPRAYSNSCPSSQWCRPAISSSVVPFSSCPQSLPASGSFPMSQLFAWGGQSIGASASTSVLPMNTQDWSLLGWTGWIPWSSHKLFPFLEILFLLASLIATHPLSLFKHLSKAAFSDYLSKHSHSTHFILIACLESVSLTVPLTGTWEEINLN